MANIIKRIVRAEQSHVVIGDLKITLKNAGDSLDLLREDIYGKPLFTLPRICESRDLDDMLLAGYITLWDENGNQIASADIEEATSLTTHKEITTISSSSAGTVFSTTLTSDDVTNGYITVSTGISVSNITSTTAGILVSSSNYFAGGSSQGSSDCEMSITINSSGVATVTRQGGIAWSAGDIVKLVVFNTA